MINDGALYVPTLRHPDAPTEDFTSGGAVSGAGGSNDVIYESSDPTTEGKTPPDITLPSMAYKRDGTGPSYGWDTVAHHWH